MNEIVKCMNEVIFCFDYTNMQDYDKLHYTKINASEVCPPECDYTRIIMPQHCIITSSELSICPPIHLWSFPL